MNDKLTLSDISNKSDEVNLSLEDTNTIANVLTSMTSMIL